MQVFRRHNLGCAALTLPVYVAMAFQEHSEEVVTRVKTLEMWPHEWIIQLLFELGSRPAAIVPVLRQAAGSNSEEVARSLIHPQSGEILHIILTL